MALTVQVQGQALKCDWVKSVNGIPSAPLIIGYPITREKYKKKQKKTCTDLLPFK